MKLSVKPFFLLAIATWISACSTGTNVESTSGASRTVKPVIVGDGSNKELLPGDKVPINWEIDSSQSKNVEIQISLDGGQNWITIESQVTNTGSYDLIVPPVPGATFRVQVVGTDPPETIAISSGTKTNPVPSMLAGSGTALSPSTDITLSWPREDYQPGSLSMEYCVIVDGKTCDSSESNWVSVSDSVPNTSGQSNTTYTVGVPYMPGTSIVYRTRGEYKGTFYTYTQTSPSSIKSDQAQVKASFSGGGGPQVKTAKSPSNSDRFSEATLTGRVDLPISPAYAKNTSTQVGNTSRFQNATLTVKVEGE